MATKKKAKKPAKVSSKRLATLAGKYAALEDDVMATVMSVDVGRFFQHVRALAASVLSQTEPVKKARK